MLKLIPQTCGRYSIDVTSGVVYDHYNSCELKADVTDRGRVYKGIAGLSRHYPEGEILAGVLVLLAMNDLTIPVYRWCELTVDYCNGNVLDVHYRNLYWRFLHGPMESECYPDFYYVPEYKNIVVSKDARVLTYASNTNPVSPKEKSESWVNYLEVSAVQTNGKSRSVKVHTLVALALCPRPGDPNKLAVNHLDLDITNNYYTNLEWLTTSLNFLHNRLMRDYSSINTIGVEFNGVVVEYKGLKSAGEELKISPVDLWVCLRHNKLTDNGYRILLLSGVAVSDDSMRYIADSRVEKADIVPVLVKHVGTGEINAFTTSDAAAAFIGTEPSGIFYHLRQPKYKVYKGTYLIIRANDTWPTQEEVDNYTPGSGKKPVLVKHVESGVVTEYQSASDAIRAVGLSKKVVTVSLRRGNQRLINGYRFQYAPAEGIADWVN